MNKIDTSQITDPNVLQPFGGPSLKFLQDSTKEAIGYMCRSLYGPQQNTGFPLVLYGLDNSAGSYSNGAIYEPLTNEVYFVNGDYVGGYTHTPVIKPFVDNDPTADPLQFYDTSFKNVHNVRYYSITDSPHTASTIYLSAVQYQEIYTLAGSASGSWTGSTQYDYHPKTGRVYISGIISIMGSGSIGTIPATHRPQTNQSISTCFKDDGQYTAGRIKITTGGVISFDANFAGSTIRGVNFDGVSYQL